MQRTLRLRYRTSELLGRRLIAGGEIAVLAQSLREAAEKLRRSCAELLTRLQASPFAPFQDQRVRRPPTVVAASSIRIEPWQVPLPAPINVLEQLLRQGGTTIVRAAFAYSFFAHPDVVRGRTPWYPERARTSREHCPGSTVGSERFHGWLEPVLHAVLV
ncbi:MAG: hypothetical protein F4070_04345 [Acidimicrobiales bacterium]|nr:hypothetical protein [Acidimicrobiales bacterium]